MSILNLSKKEILGLAYDEFTKELSELSWKEVKEVSAIVGYPVFTRKCMGDLWQQLVRG